MSGAANPTKAQIEAVERDLYARLGLTPNATGEELAASYEAVQAYLGGAPRDLRDWAKARSSEVDEAYALLSDPAALAGAVALVGAVERPARQPGGPATPPARRATPPVAEPDDGDEDEADEDDGYEEEDEAVASVTPDTHRDSVRAKSRAVPAKAAGSKARARNRRARTLRRAAAVVVVAAAAVVIAIAGYNYGPGAASASQPSPSPAAAGSPAPTLDTATVATLMEKIAANPNDTTSLLGLANAYFTAEDYQTASDWATKATVADPKSVDAFVALGASQYNLGNESAAETAWKQAIVLDPKNIEAHYDLGFLYFAAQPQNKDGAIAEWQTVIDLDPTSDLATSLKAHLDSLTGSPAPSSSTAPAGSAAPSDSATPSTSPTASPAASSSQP